MKTMSNRFMQGIHKSCYIAFRENKTTIGSKRMLNWMIQIADGMDYLESSTIVHRNLALRNVLLKNHREIKVADFCLVKHLNVTANRDISKDRWHPPETIQERLFTHRYGFGYVLYF